jgi:regulator of cell morphogenesis and NO signaling
MELETVNILDVTRLEPGQRHATIFNRLDALQAGESLVIQNDHDPKPLYYQLLRERGNGFTWEYLGSGPERWEVKISRDIRNTANETVGSIVAADYRKAEVFKKHGIDFCCKGNKSVEEACAERNIDPEIVEQELAEYAGIAGVRPLKYKNWPIDFLADYIVNTHHTYVKETAPVISELAEKVYRRHGNQHPELKSVADIVERVVAELAAHMIKEEKVLFPYVKELVINKAISNKIASPFGSVQNPVSLMEMEHEVVGKDMEYLRNITGNYSLPANACASYTLLYKLLEEFENDLHLHIHLENNILFPKAIEMEKELE